MIDTKKAFSPSVNIERDLEKSFNYIVTSNSRQIYDQLIGGRKNGVHSFSIIGSYGTGKSSFILALRKNLINEATDFKPLNGEFSDVSGFEFDFVVGKYSSLVENLISHFGLDSDLKEEDLLKWIEKKHKKLKKEGKFWFLVIDEFGKHLEYASKENPEKELYFIQQLCEFINEVDKNLFLITTLHQAFDSYANGLDIQQRKEWNKVRGRLKELNFNEPVEQLIQIAAEYLDSSSKSINENQLKKLTAEIIKSKTFPLRNELSIDFAKKLYPLDSLSAGILALSLQTYGQNERSLFSFLESDEYLGVNNFKSENDSLYNLECVYDYLEYNFHHILSSKFNPHYLQWNAIKKALQRLEAALSENINEARGIIKTIGLLNIFASEAAVIDEKFIHNYFKYSSGFDEAKSILNELENAKIIRFRRFKNQYILFEGTDLDIEFELQRATNKTDPVNDVVTYLNSYFSFSYVPAKRVYFEKGTPRFFEFKISDKPFLGNPESYLDGVINLVFNTELDSVIQESRDLAKATLFGVFDNTLVIKNRLFEIEKTKYLLSKVGDTDKVASQVLTDLKDTQVGELNKIIFSNIYEGGGNIKWIFNGELVDVSNRKELNDTLSNICNEIYFQTPVFRNELINKENVSAAIYRPRKELLKLLLEKGNEEDLGYDSNSFPADKTIYLSLLKTNELHQNTENGWGFTPPSADSGLIKLWEASEDFFNSTKTGKRDITDLMSLLKSAPYGMKSGFIELWVPIYLIMKKDSFALFQEDAYVTEFSFEIVNLVYRNPKLFQIKAFQIDDVKKILFSKYRSLHNQSEAEFSNESFVETVRPFLHLYNNLNEYGRATNTISKEAQKLREAIKSATDPEQAFFEDFVNALGYTSLEDLSTDKEIANFAYTLDNSIAEIKNSYDQLLNRIETRLKKAAGIKKMDYSDYSKELKNRFDSIKLDEIAPYQKKLLGRILSKQPGREEWLSAVGFAVLDRPLSSLEDKEEAMLLEKLEERLEELDNLRDISKSNIIPEKDMAYTFKLMPYGKEGTSQNIIIEKGKLAKEDKRISDIRKLLTKDKKMNKAILIKIIEELG